MAAKMEVFDLTMLRSSVTASAPWLDQGYQSTCHWRTTRASSMDSTIVTATAVAEAVGVLDSRHPVKVAEVDRADTQTLSLLDLREDTLQSSRQSRFEVGSSTASEDTQRMVQSFKASLTKRQTSQVKEVQKIGEGPPPKDRRSRRARRSLRSMATSASASLGLEWQQSAVDSPPEAEENMASVPEELHMDDEVASHVSTCSSLRCVRDNRDSAAEAERGVEKERSVKKTCTKCTLRSISFGDTCGPCRRLGPTGIIRSCQNCKGHYRGFAELCDECLEEHEQPGMT